MESPAKPVSRHSLYSRLTIHIPVRARRAPAPGVSILIPSAFIHEPEARSHYKPAASLGKQRAFGILGFAVYDEISVET